MNVLAFGEILWDIINGEEHLGGAPFNFAAHCARCGNQASIVSALGQDLRGQKAFDQCKTYGVDNKLIQLDVDRPTGTVIVRLENGQPDYVIIENVAWDFIQYSQDIEQLAQYYDLFYFGSLVQRKETSTATLFRILERFSFRHIFYDVNLRKGGFNYDIVSRSMEKCTILKLNTDEVPIIGRLLFSTEVSNEEFCKNITIRYPAITTILITAGDKGSYVYFNKRFELIPGTKVIVRDAVGAGDAFSAAFMHSFFKNGDAFKSAAMANHLGAFVASQHGPVPDYSAELKAALEI